MPDQPSHRRPRDSGRPDRHHPDARAWWRSRTCSPSRSRPSTACPSRSCFFVDLHDFRAHQPPEDWPTRRRGWRSSISTCSRTSARRRVHARPGCVLVAVRDYNQHAAPAERAGEDQPAPPRHRGDDGPPGLRPAPANTSCPTTSSSPITRRNCFTRVVTMAEKEGKTVDLLVVPGVDPFDAMVQTAAKLQASRLVTGVSAAHGFRRTGAPHRAGLGEAAGAAASRSRSRSSAPAGPRST